LEAGLLKIKGVAADDRLREIHEEVNRLINRWHPASLSIEKLYFAANVKTAMAVSEARGVILLTAILGGLKVYEYSPLAVKKTITGDGKADKRAMQKMIGMILKEAKDLKARDDVFDAIAVALTCCYQSS
jgi:crossover junction endodeoxyribonuclease RuvC